MQDEQTSQKPIEQQKARTHSNCHYQWLLEEKFNMMRLGFLTKKQNQRLVFWVGKVSEAVRSGPVPRSELDVCLRPVGSPLPSLAIVSGWTETYEKMLSDTRFWIRAGNGNIRKVFLLRWSKTPLHEVGCDLEVYEWDKSTRRERFSQHEVVLPENEDLDELQIVTVLFSEIFGKKFPDTDPNSSYIFSLGRLRAIAKKVIEEDGYGLRTVASGPKATGEVALAGANNSIFQEPSPFPPPSYILGQVNQLQLQLPVPPATVGTGDFEQGVPGPEQAPSMPVANNSLDPISVGAGPAEPGEVGGLPAPTTLPAPGIGVLPDGKHLDASQLPTSPRDTSIPLEDEENPNGANPLHSSDPDPGAAPHIATSPTPDGLNKPIDTKSPGCGSPFSDPPLELPEPTREVPNPSGLEPLGSAGCQTSQPGVLNPPPGGGGIPTPSLVNTELPIRPEPPEEDSPSKDPKDLADQIGNPWGTRRNNTEGKTLEQVLGKDTPSESPEDGANPSMTHVPDHTDKGADVGPESSPTAGSDKTPVIAGPAPKKLEGGVPAEAHPTSGSVKQNNDTSSPCGPNELGSPSGNSATPAEAEGVEKIDPESSGLGGPSSSILTPQTEGSENASNNPLPNGARIVVEQPTVDAHVTSSDEPNAQTISRNVNQELDATKDIPNKKVSESIADSPGKTELSLHDSTPTGVGSVDSPGLLCGGGGAGANPEPLGRASAFPRLLEDPHTPKAPEDTRAAGVGGSVHDLDTTPNILGKWSPLLKSSQDSDVSDSSYTSGISDISDISDAKVNKDTNTLQETDPIINKVDSEFEEASPSLDIDILEALKDNDAVSGVDPVDGPKSRSEPPEKNIGSFESPLNPAQDSDLLKAASDVEPSQEKDLVDSLDANSGSLLDEGLQPIQPTGSNILGAVDRSGSIEELDPISNPNTDIDPESPEEVNAPQARSAGIGDPEALGNSENTAGVTDPEAGSDPSEEASSALESLQPSDVSKVAQAADSTQQIDKTDTLRVGLDHPEGIVPAAAPLQDSIAPVVGNAVRDGALVLVDGATSTGESRRDMVSPKLLPSPATESTSQDAAPEGGSVLEDIENLETVDTLRVEPDHSEEISPAAAPLQDSITPVVENVVRDGASVLLDGATSTDRGLPPGDTVSPKLPPGPATESTSQDATLEGGSILKDIETPETVDLEEGEGIFVDTEEGFKAPGAQRREETKDLDHENLTAVELQAGGISLLDPLGLTTGDDRGISSNDGTGISIPAEGLENVPRTSSTASIATSLRKWDPGEFFDTSSDTSENNPGSTEIPGFLGTRDRTMLSEPLDAPHSHQIDLLKSPEITTPSQSASAKIDENPDLSGIACKKEESTRFQSHVVAVKSDVDSQKGTQEADEAELQKMEMGSVGYFTAAALPPTPQPDRPVPECSKCSQAAVLGRSEHGSNQYAPAGNPKSLEGEGSPRSKVDIQSNRRLSISSAFSFVSSLWGKSASPTPPATPPQASNTEVHEAADTVATPQEAAPAIKTPGSQRPAGQGERKVSWDDIVGGGRRGRSESSGSPEESSPDHLFLPPATAVGNSIAGEGPYAGDPLGIGVQLGDNVYSLMSTEVHTSGHSASDQRVIKAKANSLTRTSPASEHYEEPPSADTGDEVAQIAVASYCRRTSDETEDKESLVASPRPRTRAVNRAVAASPIKSPFPTSMFPWSDSQRIPFAAPSTARGGAPTPAIGPLGECSYARSPAVGRTPRVGAESPCLLGQASCVHASNSIRSLGPTPTTTDPNGSARCIHSGSPPTDFRPVGGRLAPLPGISGASVRGMQSGRYQSAIQEEGEGFAHSSVDESDRISPERFSRLEHLIKRFAQEHFSQLPPSLRVFESSASLSRSLFPPEFLCTSSLGKRLRIAAVQNIICRHLVNSIFSATVPSFCFNMEAIAGELMKLDPLKQALWQALTVEALEALPQYEMAAAKLRQRTVNEILVSIGAISASPAATLTESLQNLVKSAQEAWEPTFKSKAQTIPEVDVENGTANFKMDPEDSLVRESFGLQAESIARPVLCLFPAIYQIIDGHDILVAPGRALFSDLYHSAEMELQARLDTWNSDQKYARRASFMRPPFVPHNTHPLASPEPESGRWSTRRMSHEYFGHNQWCSHPNDFEDEAIDFWDVSRRLKEYDQEVLRHERGRSAGSETFSERRSSYVSRSRSFSSGRRESVYARQESVYERRVPMGGRRESFYGGRRESFRGSRDHCGW